MNEFLNNLKNIILNFSVLDGAIIILITMIAYFILKFLLKNNAKYIAIFFVLWTIIAGIFFVIFTDKIRFSFLFIPLLFILFIVIIFSTEIKREIWKRDKSKTFDIKLLESDEFEKSVNSSTQEIIKALQNMSKNDIGALIVLVKQSIPNQIVESGVKVEAKISSQLIESIFFPKTPLHDGAMLIKGDKIISAGCFLPLSQNDNVPKELGTRHRAGIGITETTDVIALIVSEETGIISIVESGVIKRYADSIMLNNTLMNYYKTIFENANKKNNRRR